MNTASLETPCGLHNPATAGLRLELSRTNRNLYVEGIQFSGFGSVEEINYIATDPAGTVVEAGPNEVLMVVEMILWALNSENEFIPVFGAPEESMFSIIYLGSDPEGFHFRLLPPGASLEAEAPPEQLTTILPGADTFNLWGTKVEVIKLDDALVQVRLL